MNVSYQLYSSRDGGPWADTIRLLADIGYTQVEGFGGVYEDAAATRAMLDAAGLTMPSGHFFPLGALEDDFAASISTAKTLGMERVFCPAPEDVYRNQADAATWIAFAKRMEEVHKRVTDNGLRFGWHNHHWEFMALPTGERPMALILEHAPSIEWEMDVAWVVRGGADPLEWIANHGSRISTAHVKDIAPQGECEDEDGWADVGHGTLDWAGLTAVLREAGTDLFVMEHDNPSDAARFAKRSFAAFTGY